MRRRWTRAWVLAARAEEAQGKRRSKRSHCELPDPTPTEILAIEARKLAVQQEARREAAARIATGGGRWAKAVNGQVPGGNRCETCGKRVHSQSRHCLEHRVVHSTPPRFVPIPEGPEVRRCPRCSRHLGSEKVRCICRQSVGRSAGTTEPDWQRTELRVHAGW